MGVFRFEDLEVWKLAKEHCDEIDSIIRQPLFQSALLYLAHGRGYLKKEEFTRLLNRNTRIGKMLRSLYNHLSGRR
jgi:hypothetical protein